VITRFLLAALIWLGSWPALAQVPTTGAGKGAPSAAGGCSQATAILARMDGTQNTPAVTTAVCALAANGSLGDLRYVFATSSATNAKLNWAQSAFNLTQTGTETFTANAGFQGDGSTGFFDTGFNPSTAGGSYTQNSASIGACVLTSRTVSQAYVEIGASDNSTLFSYIEPLQTSLVNYELNGGTFPNLTNSNAQGSWIVSRTSSSAIALYKNGSSVATPSDTSTGLPPVDLSIGAFNTDAGGIVDFSADLLAYTFAGGGLTPTQIANDNSIMHAYLVAVGAPSGC
jgi:hypothetical protein